MLRSFTKKERFSCEASLFPGSARVPAASPRAVSGVSPETRDRRDAPAQLPDSALEKDVSKLSAEWSFAA